MARHGIESPSVKYGLGAQDNDDKKQEELDNDDIETTPKRLKRQSTMAETVKVKTQRCASLASLVLKIGKIGKKPSIPVQRENKESLDVCHSRNYLEFHSRF